MNWGIVLAIVLLVIIALFVIGPFLLSLALNYVFSLFFAWKLISNPIVITFWQSFWLIIAAIIIRVILFGQHLNFIQGVYRPYPRQVNQKKSPPA